VVGWAARALAPAADHHRPLRARQPADARPRARPGHRVQRLWDTDDGRLLLARDRLGIKPLYYADSPDRLRFASTLPALVAGGVDTAVDPVALHHYLSWHGVVPPPHTLLRGVRKVPPATTVVVEPDGRWDERRYWEPPFARRGDAAGWSDEDWTDAVVQSLRDAVQWRMVSDVGVGVLLSGGLDSSLIVALLADLGHEDVATFSIGFASGAGREGDEFPWSDLVAERPPGACCRPRSSTGPRATSRCPRSASSAAPRSSSPARR
jgi:asparagine synthetase B (glutamine-hydrolysing)